MGSQKHDPVLIALGGPTGAGKSTLAHRLQRFAPSLGDALILDSDVIRRELRGHDLRSIMQDEDYTPEVTAQVRLKMDEMTRDALKKGRSVIDTSGFWSVDARAAVQSLCQECNARFVGLWLDVPDDILRQRITRRLAERKDLPDLSVERGHASDACLAVLEKYALQMPTSAPEGWRIVSGRGSEAEVAKQCLSLLFR